MCFVVGDRYGFRVGVGGVDLGDFGDERVCKIIGIGVRYEFCVLVIVVFTGCGLMVLGCLYG